MTDFRAAATRKALLDEYGIETPEQLVRAMAAAKALDISQFVLMAGTRADDPFTSGTYRFERNSCKL